MLGLIIFTTISLRFAEGSALIKVDNAHNMDHLTTCVIKIIEGIDFKNLSRRRDVTVVNDSGDLKLSALHNKENIRIVSRKFSWETRIIKNNIYIIICKNFQELENGLANMTLDPFWNPTASFVIVMQDLENDSLERMTKTLHKYNVLYNVTIISQIDADFAIYMYNITSPSNCVQDKYLTLVSRCSIYRDKSSLPFLKYGGIRNCNFTLIYHNAWPYVRQEMETVGMEQYVMSLFKNYSGINIDVYPTVALNKYGEAQENFTISLAQRIVRNEAEGVFGGLSVKPFYTGNFSYSNPWRVDRVSIILPHAAIIRQWVSVSQDAQFTFVLLALLFISFCLAVSYLSIFPRREKDVFLDILTVFGYFLNKSMARNTRPGWSRSLIVGALLYASFIFPFVFQTNLYSVTTQPFRTYEPQSIEEILKFQPILNEESLETLYFPRYVNCGSRYNCLQSLVYDKNNRKFTAMTDLYFFLYQYKLIDKWCNPALYKLKEPLIKTLRTFIFRRGSVLLQPINRFLFAVDTSGVLEKKVRDMFRRQRKFCPPGRPPLYHPIKLTEIFPVFILLLIGYCLSGLVFLYELRFKGRRK